MKINRCRIGFFLITFACLNSFCIAQTIPKLGGGKVIHLENFKSTFVDARNIDIWIPSNYSRKKHYNVLYMHDGQSLFNAALNFNNQAWRMDEAMNNLLKNGRIVDTIIVGVWNNGVFRHTEFYPEKYLPFVNPVLREKFIKLALQNKPLADNYLKFIVTEVKPYIDKKFSTYSDREHTFMMGSSMGGMISMYAICEYPDIFGGIAALSTHWIGTYENNTEFPVAAFTYLQDHIPAPATHRIYMDHGTRELDSNYAAHQAYVDEIIKTKGYDNSKWMSKVFEGATHNENDWSKRVEIPLLFLLGTPSSDN